MEPEIKINVAEAASELAVESVYQELGHQGEEAIYCQSSNHVEYTPEAQQVFDKWYDFYYDFFNKHKID